MIAIAACDPQGVMGHQGRLPWNEPDDLDHFRAMTRHNIMVLGRKTFEGMPLKAFAEREGIVLSRTLKWSRPLPLTIKTASTLEACLGYIHPQKDQNVYVIGGQQIFEIFFARGLIHKTILTRLYQQYQGDTFFPLHELEKWQCVSQNQHDRFVIETWVP